MKKVSLIIHKKYVENVIHTLHQTGMVELIDITQDDPELLKDIKRADMHHEAGTCAEYELRLQRLIDILNKNIKKPAGIKAMLNPTPIEKTPMEPHTLEDLYSYAESILHDIEHQILEHEKHYQEKQSTLEHLTEQHELLKKLTFFDFTLTDLNDTTYLHTIAGTTPDLEKLQQRLATITNETHLSTHQLGSGKKREWIVLITTHISHKEAVDKLARELITPIQPDISNETPQKAVKTIEAQQKNLKKEQKKITQDLQQLASTHIQELRAIKEELSFERIRKEIPKHFAETTSTYVIKAWVQEKHESQLKQLIQHTTDNSYIYESTKPTQNPDNPPTYLKIPKWAQSFHTFLELFATPRYNELNPTVPMGIFFILFFGLMLGDAGYGIVILFLSLFAYLKFGKASSTLRNWSFLGIWLGIATTTAGFLMNSLFGDLIPRFFYGNPEQPLYQLTIMGIQLPLEPLTDPLTILTLALVCGIIHLNLGIILGIIQAYHQHNIKKLFTNHFAWIPLQIGGGLLIGNMILGWEITTMMTYIAAALTVIGIILLFANAGPIGFFDITGYIGDWLSYARLLALGLATAGMALAFNVVGELIPNMVPYIGIILLPIILIVAHLANLIIQALGAGVHSLRLQYVEFFNRFYEGGGHAFSPFKMTRKYTIIENKKEK